MKVFFLSMLIILNFSVFSGCSSSEVEEGDAEKTEESAEKGDASGDEDLDEEFDADEELADDDESFDEDEAIEGEEQGNEVAEDSSGEEGDEALEGEEAQEESDDLLAEEEATENANDAEQEIEEQGDVASEIEEDPMPAEPAEDMAAIEEDVPSDDMIGDEETEVQAWVPVRKMANEPFSKNGVLANTLYIVRDGDTMESISQKIYADDKTEDLYSVNTTLREGIKVGDKVYYNSPQRPSDQAQMMTSYQDMGMEPEIYITKEGDNIRAVAQNLLGHPRSWMEVYATNMNVDTKAELGEGMELRYWAGSGAAMAVASNNDMPPPSAMNDMPSEPPAMPEPDMPAPTQASNDFPPPPPPPPPSLDEPPPVAAAASLEPPPPPPPPRPKRNMRKKQAVAESGDQDEIMYMGAGAVLLFLAVMIAVIRKKKSRQTMDFNTHTQIE